MYNQRRAIVHKLKSALRQMHSVNTACTSTQWAVVEFARLQERERERERERCTV